MIQSYRTPQAFKMALEQRLRNEALRSGQRMERLRQLLVFDRFLARVFSCFEDTVVLKGGLVLELRLERARTTKDVDLRMMGRADDLLFKLQVAGRLELHDYLSFEVRPDDEHPVIEAEGLQYEGRRYRAEARLAGRLYGMPFGVDVALAEPLVGEPETIVGNTFLGFAGIEPVAFRVYPIETHIAEKLHAYTLTRPRPNSRRNAAQVKDLPDIALLASVGPLQGGRVRIALEKTFLHRATHELPEVLPDPPPSWAPVYERMARMDGLRWRTLEQVKEAVAAFVNPVLADLPDHWEPARWGWQ